MAKKIAVIGGRSQGRTAALVGALLAAAGPEGIKAMGDAVVKSLKSLRPTGNPTPESIARRKRRNLKRRLDSIAGWKPFTSNGRTGPEIQSSTRGDRRREKLGRA